MQPLIKIPGGNRPLQFQFVYNGRPVKAYRTDSIASALTRAGLRIFSRSMKFHRPRGLYCGMNRCFSCAMRVNGIPGVRTCSTPAREGMVVESEGGLPSVKYDLLSILDQIFRKQLDYHSRFIRPSFMVPTYQRVVRRLVTPRSLPDQPASFHKVSDFSVDVLVVGHGLSGSAASEILRKHDLKVLVVDQQGTGTDRPSTAFGYYEDGRVGILDDTGAVVVRPRELLLATGRVETALDLPNSDLPGVMLPHAVGHLARAGVKPGSRAFLVGTNETKEQVVRDLGSVGCEIVGGCENPGNVERIVGRKSVRSIRVIQDDGRVGNWACDTVVILGPLVPYVNLAQQAGCGLKHAGDFWIVETNQSGRTTNPSVYSSGSVAGFVTKEERVASGKNAGRSILRVLGVE